MSAYALAALCHISQTTCGRDCTMVARPSAHTPSMSCGAPSKAASTAREASAMALNTWETPAGVSDMRPQPMGRESAALWAAQSNKSFQNA